MIATRRLINSDEVKTRTGDEENMEEANNFSEETGPTQPKAERLYPTGKRLSNGEATKSRFTSPKDHTGGENMLRFRFTSWAL